MELTLFVDLINCRGQFINANDVIAFCLYLMNKMRRNLIKVTRPSFFGGVPSYCLLFLACHYTAFLFSTRAMTTLG